MTRPTGGIGSLYDVMAQIFAGQNNNNVQFRPRFERRWDQVQRFPGQQWNNYEQPRPQERGQNYQQRPGGNVNVGPRRMDEAKKPGPSYWVKESNESSLQREQVANFNTPGGEPSNNKRALN